MAHPFKADKKIFRDAEEAAKFFEENNPSSDEVTNSETNAIKRGYVKSHNEFVEYMNKFSIELTKRMMRTAFPKTVMITHSVMAIDEIDKIVNTLYERLDEMYSLFSPEAASDIGSIKDFIKLVLKGGNKRSSMGIEADENSAKVIRSLAIRIDELLKLRDELSDYIEGEMGKQCMNLTELCGAMLGARLLSLAGSLKKLARMPSSTVQVLGAEKALFRHLISGAKPPKHGVILQHPFVATSKNRGRAARKLAAKIAIGAKMDFYSKKNIGKQLRESLEAHSE
jgi:nucleolar protein 56